ncbi:MAG: MBL fold metallo-hydrolase, partial [Anaerolineaceae bacterium]|nr:MBL fold metallo-hydrolase [Anaerolineaceae bacterium]
MSVTARASRIDAHTWLIDAGLYGLAGAAAVYLVRGSERSCLVDAGPRVDAAAYPGPIVRALERLHLFPPDLVILTHAHHDHAHGMPALRRAAARQGRRMEVLASWQALPLLEDAGYNQPPGSGEFEGISGVTPVREGDRLDLGGIVLRVCEVPGHCTEHIAILDETNGNLFVGDALGLRLGPGCTLPPFMPPSWDPDSFCQSVERLKGLGAHRLCLT